MRRFHYRHRVDEGQADIVRALRAAHCSAVLLDNGAGVPDLLVGAHGRTLLLEIKSPAGVRGGLSRSGQRLNAAQEAFAAAWQGGPILVVTSADDALEQVRRACQTNR